MITREQFVRYEDVRVSGATNMWGYQCSLRNIRVRPRTMFRNNEKLYKIKKEIY